MAFLPAGSAAATPTAASEGSCERADCRLPVLPVLAEERGMAAVPAAAAAAAAAGVPAGVPASDGAAAADSSPGAAAAASRGLRRAACRTSAGASLVSASAAGAPATAATPASVTASSPAATACAACSSGSALPAGCSWMATRRRRVAASKRADSCSQLHWPAKKEQDTCCRGASRLQLWTPSRVHAGTEQCIALWSNARRTALQRRRRRRHAATHPPGASGTARRRP